MGETDNGTPIRDIVIETRVDVRHIRESLDKLSECIRDHDERLREIEIEGSKISQINTANIVKLKARVTNLEDAGTFEKTIEQTKTRVETQRNHWVDTIYTKIGIVCGILFAFAAFVKAWWFS